METAYRDFAVQQAAALLGIDSPTGYTEKAAQWVLEAFQALGFEAHLTRKGGVLICLGGEDAENAVLLEAHTDTLGAMVAEVKANGRLRVTALGGMQAQNGEAENVKVYTRDGRVYEGTLQLINASVHVNGAYAKTERSFDTTEVVLDEDVASKADAEKLGIMTGDIVCFDPRTHVTSSGYIKSRFLDDKLSVGILLGLAKYIHDSHLKLQRRVYAHVTVYAVPSLRALQTPSAWTWAVWARGYPAQSGRSPSAARTPAAPTAIRWSPSSSPPPGMSRPILPLTSTPTTAPMWRPPSPPETTFATVSSVQASMPAMAMSAAISTAL